MGQPVQITLSVEAARLYTDYPPETQPTQELLDTYCHMSDDNSGSIVPPTGTVNDFTSQVYDNQRVIWRINRYDQDNPRYPDTYQVKILSIVNNSDPAFFDPSTISAPEGGAASVNGKCQVSSGEDTYTINFRVSKTGGEDQGHNDYNLDPKLGGNP